MNCPLTSQYKRNLVHLNLELHFIDCAFLHNTKEQQTSKDVQGGNRNASPESED
jgi:hypothetical protein